MDYIKNRKLRHNRKRIMVGITTRSPANIIQWLKDFLTEKFQDLILDVEHLPITNTNRYEWENNVNKYSVVILYHTRHQGRVNITDVDGGIYNEELNFLCHKLGREKVLVVLDDMEDTSEEVRQRILESQPSLTRLSSHLILLPEIGKFGAASNKREEFLTVLGAEQTSSYLANKNILGQTTSRTGPGDNNIWGNRCWHHFATQSPDKKNPQSSLVKYKVGIFSRSGDDNYQWLVGSLQTANVGGSIDVCKVYISNNYHSHYAEISRCNFAILYHTKKQGRLNITDVIDSLYDQELKELSEFLGKENVIVVVDDLMDASNEEKQRILKHQHSISSLAGGLFLFSEQHKDPETMEEIMTIIRNDGRRNVIRVDIDIKEKLQIWENEQHKDPQMTVIENHEKTTYSDDENIMDHTSSRTRPVDFCGHGSFVTTRNKNPRSSLVKYKVGVFSRSGNDNYQWLVNSLQTANIGRSIDVCNVYVSNNFQSYYSKMSLCNFAILYHTKKQGRLNITDITDSIYDKELRELSEFFGKDNVIVVVDDLMDASNEEKQRILGNQPSIGSLAKDLFLFREQHKDPETLREIRILIEKNVSLDESCTMKPSPVSELQYTGAQGVGQHPGPPQNTYDESILMTDNDDDGSPLYHLRGTTRSKPSGAKYDTDSLFSDIYTSRKRPNYNPCAYDHESSSSLKKKNSFEEQEPKKIWLEAKPINVSDDTPNTASWMDNQIRVLNDTGSAFFARLSELNDSWQRFQRAVQNPQSEIQQLLSKTHTQAEELKEKDIVILNLRKEVRRLQSEIEEKQRTIEEKDKFIDKLKGNRDRPVDKTQEGRGDRLEHPAGTLEEIIQEKEKAIMQLCVEIQNLREKPQDQEKSEELQGPLRKRRGAKKWTSEDMKNEQDGGLDAHSTSEPETMESHSTIEDLWQRIAELESRLKHLEYTTDSQRQELDKYRQTVKEQSSKLKGYEELVDSLLNKTEDMMPITK